jgi:hypothetical protein
MDGMSGEYPPPLQLAAEEIALLADLLALPVPAALNGSRFASLSFTEQRAALAATARVLISQGKLTTTEPIASPILMGVVALICQADIHAHVVRMNRRATSVLHLAGRGELAIAHTWDEADIHTIQPFPRIEMLDRLLSAAGLSNSEIEETQGPDAQFAVRLGSLTLAARARSIRAAMASLEVTSGQAQLAKDFARVLVSAKEVLSIEIACRDESNQIAGTDVSWIAQSTGEVWLVPSPVRTSWNDPVEEIPDSVLNTTVTITRCNRVSITQHLAKGPWTRSPQPKRKRKPARGLGSQQ